jgi:hypothetical protein
MIFLPCRLQIGTAIECLYHRWQRLLRLFAAANMAGAGNMLINGSCPENGGFDFYFRANRSAVNHIFKKFN